jgi:LacI family transcriptional regulator
MGGAKNRFKETGIPTIKDVARHAGVAPGTVSNVLSGRRAVTDELKRRVAKSIEALGYRPNSLASSLRLQRSNTIGVVVPDLTNPFFAALVRQLEEVAGGDGYRILLVDSNEEEGREADRLRALLSHRIDGLIMAPARDDVAALAEQGAHLPPTVLMDRAFAQQGFDTVSIDNFEAGRSGCRHLVDLGHRDIAFVVTSPRLMNMRERIDGYRAGLAEAGLADHARIIAGGFDVEGCRAAVEQELRRARRPTALFAATYVATLGAVKAIRALALDFPGDISLLAFDDTDWMTVLRPYLSAVAQPVPAMADEVWRLLRDRLAGSSVPCRHVRLPAALLPRESTQVPRGAGADKSRREPAPTP